MWKPKPKPFHFAWACTYSIQKNNESDGREKIIHKKNYRNRKSQKTGTTTNLHRKKWKCRNNTNMSQPVCTLYKQEKTRNRRHNNQQIFFKAPTNPASWINNYYEKERGEKTFCKTEQKVFIACVFFVSLAGLEQKWVCKINERKMKKKRKK